MTDDGHAMASSSTAVNRAFCGTPSLLSTGDQFGAMFLKDHELTNRPIREIIVSKWGSVPKYCATVTMPYFNNENALMLIESWIMSAGPGLSLHQVGRVLLVVKIVMLSVFVLALMRIGIGIAVGAAALQVAAVIMLGLQQTFSYSYYTFFFCMIALMIGVYTLAIDSIERPWAVAVFAVLAGLLSAFCGNMRTSYIPVFAALFAVYLYVSDRRNASARLPWRPRLRALAITAVCFVAGYMTFQYVFIARSRPPGKNNLSYHHVAHPLVLALGDPRNPLSEREGITWSDAVGPEIVQRIDPKVVAYSPEYEEVLYEYYRSLWQRYPAEMRQIYLSKAKLAGRHMIENAQFADPLITAGLKVMHVIPNGLWMSGAFALVALLAALGMLRKTFSSAEVLVCLVAVAGLLLMLEASLIIPYFYLSYGSSLLLCCMTLLLLLVEGIVTLVGRVTGLARLLGAARPQRREAAHGA